MTLPKKVCNYNEIRSFCTNNNKNNNDHFRYYYQLSFIIRLFSFE